MRYRGRCVPEIRIVEPIQRMRNILIAAIVLCAVAHATAQDEEGCTLPANKKAEKLYEKAKATKATSERREILKETIEAEPDHYAALADLTLIDVRKAEKSLTADYRFAEEKLLRVDELCPTYHPYIAFYLGNLAFVKKEYKKAMAYYDRFLKFDIVDPSTAPKDHELRVTEAEAGLNQAKLLDQLYTNPVPMQLSVVKDLSTKDQEYLGILSPDGEVCLFIRGYQKQGRNELTPRQVEEFTIAHRRPDGTFEKGKAMAPPFNLTENVGSATLTIDNQRMFLTICDFDADGYKNCDIFMSEMKKGEWQKPKNLGTGVNGKKSFEGQPTVTPDGKTLYFVSIREDEIGTINDMDLYMSRIGANGEWGPAKNLGRTVNTKGNEKSPFIHEDSHTLYFSSDGHPGIGKFDIYLTRLDSTAKWITPKNIGYPINTVHDDVGFFVSVDGHTAFLSSNEREGVGGWDLFSFPLYKEARPDKVMFVRGQLKDADNQPVTDARIELKNVRTQEVAQFDITHPEGKYVAVMNMSDDVVMTVKKDGAAFNAKYIAKSDSTTMKTTSVDLTVKEQTKGSVHRLDNINFGTNSADLAKESEHILNEFAAYLKANPQLKVAIHGHTDNVGDDRANLLLSESRAEAVNQFLVRKGIDGARLSYLGLGESKPITTNDTPAGRALNRRTEFVIQ